MVDEKNPLLHNKFILSNVPRHNVVILKSVIKTMVLLKVRKRALSQIKYFRCHLKSENLKNYNHVAQYYNTVIKLSHKK